MRDPAFMSANQRARRGDKGIWMKWWLWLSTAAVVTVGVIIFAGKDDILRYNRMRRM